jgi:hypothetical protein
MIPQRTLVRLGAVPDAPTIALPGTEEKIQVMIERAARRQQLFHPLDGRRARRFPALAKTGLLVPTRTPDATQTPPAEEPGIAG